MNMYKMAALALFGAAAITACSDSTSPEGTGTVTMGAQVSNSTVVSSMKRSGGDAVQGQPTIDSITVDRVRILLSRLKFKRASEDTTQGRDVKTGPAVVTFEADTVVVVFKDAVPVGTYDRVKLEKHRFSSNEVEKYKNDPVFGDFAYPDKLTLIIDGSVWSDGEEKPFTFTDDATENMWIDFVPNLEVTEGQATAVDIYFDGKLAFLGDGTLLDPFDLNGRKDISKNLKKAFKILKRSL
jgi:hypothetical protein